jgi:hypothetical protein
VSDCGDCGVSLYGGGIAKAVTLANRDSLTRQGELGADRSRADTRGEGRLTLDYNQFVSQLIAPPSMALTTSDACFFPQMGMILDAPS